MALLLVLGAGAGLVAAPPAAAATAVPCRLPGYVSSVRSAPCPPSPTAGPPGRDSILGSLFGSLTGGLAGDVFRALEHIALVGAADAVRVTGSLIAATTRPALASTWFSAAYWRVAAVSTLLTLPFLFAAGVHALVRADLTLIARAAFGYLPLALLGVSIAAPLTTLVLAAIDEMSAFVAGAAGGSDSSFLARAAADLTTPSLIHGDLLVAFLVAVLTVMASISLWIELLIRGAAVDVIVLMLPLFFAAMVWPARRVWAVRAIETLIALILSKFAIVAVLTLGGAALSQLANGPAALLTGATLILLATLSPWALLRLLPLHEVAAAAAGGLSRTPQDAVRRAAGQVRVPGGGQGRDPRDGDPADATDANAEPELAAAAALRGLLALDDVLNAGRRGGPTDGGGDGTGEEAWGPETDLGLQAASSSGRRPTDPAVVLPAITSPGGERLDGRPPIEEPFGGERWEGFVLGDQGDERMEAPRIAGRDPDGRDPGGRDADPGADLAGPIEPPNIDPPPPVEPPTVAPLRLLPAPASDDTEPPTTDDAA